MNPKTRFFFIFFIGALAGMFAMYVFSNYKIEKKTTESNYYQTQSKNSNNQKDKPNSTVENSGDISAITDENYVINYVKKNKKLPEYYITKNEAKNQGWIASQGNLCNVLPGRAIGGDKFTNREKQLPKGEHYFEADVNYNCGRRNADRIVFTKNGDVYLTKNHYKTFEKQ